MTKAFIARFRRSCRCDFCRTHNGHLCPTCQVAARLRWHTHVASRVTKGLCIQCNRKPKPNEQRCPRCAKANRETCGVYYHSVRKVKVQQLQAQGTCTQCFKRPVHKEGGWYCESCLQVRRVGAPAVKKPYKFVGLALT